MSALVLHAHILLIPYSCTCSIHSRVSIDAKAWQKYSIYIFQYLQCRDEINLQYIFQHLESWEPTPINPQRPKVLSYWRGWPADGSVRRPDNRLPSPFLHIQWPKTAYFWPRNVLLTWFLYNLSIIQDTFREIGTFSPLLTCGERNFWLHTAFDPKIPDFWRPISNIYSNT